MKFKILVFLVLISESLFSQTVQGCRIGSGYGSIYTNLIEANREWVVNPYYKPKFDTYDMSQTKEFKSEWWDANNCPHYLGNPSIGASQCMVVGLSYFDSNGTAINQGNTIIYTLTYPTCTPPSTPVPLDDYTPLLIIVFLAIGFYYLKSRKIILLNKA